MLSGRKGGEEGPLLRAAEELEMIEVPIFTPDPAPGSFVGTGSPLPRISFATRTASDASGVSEKSISATIWGFAQRDEKVYSRS